MSQLEIEFEKVTASPEQIDELFNLLCERLHRISHEDVSYNEHKGFVCSHPYRVWFLVRARHQYIGSFYIKKDNSVGINVSERFVPLVVKPIIEFVVTNYKPLVAIPSIRNGSFAINVPPANWVLAESLKDIGAEVAQVTYYLPN
ncbi:hypothetical protein N9361_00070 [Alphaproteobacteria bacterium]|jgi:hypothetical protein|nr:hypothetical protein [Alphaproteobacteria bacterium]